MTKQMIVPIGNEQKVVVEVFDLYDGIPPEAYIYIQTSHGDYDICMVRPHYEYDSTSSTPIIHDNKFDCMVWANPNVDDYTDKFVIKLPDEE